MAINTIVAVLPQQFHSLARNISRLLCRQFLPFVARELCVKPHYQQGGDCVGRDHRHCSIVSGFAPESRSARPTCRFALQTDNV